MLLPPKLCFWYLWYSTLLNGKNWNILYCRNVSVHLLWSTVGSRKCVCVIFFVCVRAPFLVCMWVIQQSVFFPLWTKHTGPSDPLSWWINCLHMGMCFNFWTQFPTKTRCLSQKLFRPRTTTGHFVSKAAHMSAYFCLGVSSFTFLYGERQVCRRSMDTKSCSCRQDISLNTYERPTLPSKCISDLAFWASMKHDLRRYVQQKLSKFSKNS